MTQIQFPSGETVDFGDVSDDQIKQSITVLRQKNPELFEEADVDYSTMSYEEIAERGRSQYSGLLKYLVRTA
jgi:hypothetical protein